MLISSEDLKQRIFTAAICSRGSLLILQYIFNVIVPDHEAAAFIYPKQEDTVFPNTIVSHFLGGFVRWDAQHFMHISIHGYTYEHSLAFFPFYPFLAKLFTLPLSYLVPFLSIDSLTLITFITLNTICFIKAALCLYELSLHIVTKDLAFKASILFCYNPASIFFSAPYSESLYCYLSFKSMLNCVLLYKKYNKADKYFKLEDVAFIIPVCLSTFTRSNGILNIGFLIYMLICLHIKKIKSKNEFNHLQFITVSFLLTVFCLSPFVLFQVYAYYTFCKDFSTNLPSVILQHKDIETFVLPGSFSKHNQSWCNKKIPLAYSYIQSHYWKVGFLKYYEFKQIPNFILAAPLILILLQGALKFYKKNSKNIYLFTFDLLDSKNINRNMFNRLMTVFVVHSTVLTFFCVFNIHIQVTTRMLCSASPVVYWFSAFQVSEILNSQSLFRKISNRNVVTTEFLLIIYYLSYFVIGAIMFCNFLPWT